MDCSLSGSSVHGIFQARVLEWIAISFCRASSRPRDRTWVSHIAGRCFTIWATKLVTSKENWQGLIKWTIFLQKKEKKLKWHMGLWVLCHSLNFRKRIYLPDCIPKHKNSIHLQKIHSYSLYFAFIYFEKDIHLHFSHYFKMALTPSFCNQ